MACQASRPDCGRRMQLQGRSTRQRQHGPAFRCVPAASRSPRRPVAGRRPGPGRLAGIRIPGCILRRRHVRSRRHNRYGRVRRRSIDRHRIAVVRIAVVAAARLIGSRCKDCTRSPPSNDRCQRERQQPQPCVAWLALPQPAGTAEMITWANAYGYSSVMVNATDATIPAGVIAASRAAAPPVIRSVGCPEGRFTTPRSEKNTPRRKPVPSALAAASLAANRLA